MRTHSFIKTFIFGNTTLACVEPISNQVGGSRRLNLLARVKDACPFWQSARRFAATPSHEALRSKLSAMSEVGAMSEKLKGSFAVQLDE